MRRTASSTRAIGIRPAATSSFIVEMKSRKFVGTMTMSMPARIAASTCVG